MKRGRGFPPFVVVSSLFFFGAVTGLAAPDPTCPEKAETEGARLSLTPEELALPPELLPLVDSLTALTPSGAFDLTVAADAGAPQVEEAFRTLRLDRVGPSPGEGVGPRTYRVRSRAAESGRFSYGALTDMLIAMRAPVTAIAGVPIDAATYRRELYPAVRARLALLALAAELNAPVTPETAVHVVFARDPGRRFLDFQRYQDETGFTAGTIVRRSEDDGAAWDVTFRAGRAFTGRPFAELANRLFVDFPEVVRIGERMTRPLLDALVADHLVQRPTTAPRLLWTTAPTGPNADQTRVETLVQLTLPATFRTFRRHCERTADGNAMVSVFGADSAILAAALGARGRTQEQMLQQMDLLGYDLDQIVAARRSLQTVWGQRHRLNTSENFMFIPGIFLNAAFMRPGQDATYLRPEYQTLVRQAFGATAQTVDFRDAAQVREHGVIRSPDFGEALESVPLGQLTDARVVLFNYLRVAGEHRLSFHASEVRHFDVERNGRPERVEHQMYEATGAVPYVDYRDFQAVSLPSSRTAVTLDFVLPKPDVSLEQLVRHLDGHRYRALVQQFAAQTRPGDVRVVVPRVEGIEIPELDLRSLYESLGMRALFGGGADFSAMTASDRLYISRFFQKLKYYFHRDVFGASALTIMAAPSYGLPNFEETPGVPQIVINRPHLVIIRETATNQPLFTFRINDPRG